MPTIGSKGLATANLVIPQSTSLSFVVEHLDSEGGVIDHDGWTVHVRLQGKDDISENYLLDDYVSEDSEGNILVTIPPEISATIPIGTYNWDMIADDPSGQSTRLVYGSAKVIDTYAKD